MVSDGDTWLISGRLLLILAAESHTFRSLAAGSRVLCTCLDFVKVGCARVRLRSAEIHGVFEVKR